MTLRAVDVAIVNYDTRDMLRDCLQSLRGQRSLGSIRVADNGSTDGSFDMVAHEFPDVDLVSLPHNPGFGAAANVLIERSDAAVVVVLNADARLDADALHTLGTYLHEHPAVAIAGPRLRHDDGSLQRSCFHDPNVRELLWQESGAHRWRRNGLATFDHATSRSVPWVLGAAMAIRRSAFVAVGGFDPGFFLYYEETDLCRRLRDAGHEIHFVADAGVLHHGGSSTGRHSELAQRTLYRSLRRYHHLHDSARPAALRCAVVSIMAARLARDTVRTVVAHDAVARANRSTWAAIIGDARDDWSGDAVTPRPHAPAPAPQRLDWLVLLPEPATSVTNVVVLGAAHHDDLAALAEHFGVDRVGHRIDDRPIDVLIVSATADDDLADALGHLTDGGVAHIARSRGHDGFLSPDELAAVVRGAGLRLVSRHWTLPDAEAPRRHVPLDAVPALRWYLDRLFIAAGRSQRIARRAMRTRPTSARIIARAHSAVAVRGTAKPRTIATLSGVADPIAAHLLVMTSGHDVGSRTIVMPFVDGCDEPQCVVKVSSRAAMNETTRREHDTLVALHRVLPADLDHTVPRPIGLDTWRGRLVSTESLLSGPSLEVELRRDDHVDRRIALLGDVTDWIMRFHSFTAEAVPCDDDFVDTWLAAPFVRYTEMFDTNSEVTELFAAAIDAARSLHGAPVPIVRRHVDLGPWNIICTTTPDGHGLGVIDWESAGDRPGDGRGLPFCDLDYFIKYWLHIVGDASDAAAEDRLFATLATPDHLDTRYGIAALDSVAAYGGRLGVDPRLVPALAVHNWVEQALYGSARDDMLARTHTAMSASRSIEALARRRCELFG